MVKSSATYKPNNGSKNVNIYYGDIFTNSETYLYLKITKGFTTILEELCS